MTAPAAPAAAPAAHDAYAHKWPIAIGVVLAAIMELVQTTSVNLALTQMSGNLGASLDEVTWVTTGYILAAVIILPMTGWLATFFGRKRYFTGSILVFTVASVMSGLSASLGALVFWQIVSGLGGGALIATGQAILFESFPPEEKTVAAAIFGLGMMAGPALGPTLGGIIVNRYSWPWIFFMNIPVGLAAALMVTLFVKDPNTSRRAGRVDGVGFALLAIGIGALQFVLERGEHYDWLASRLIAWLSVVAAVALVGLVWWELRVDEPVIDLRVLRDRSLSAGSLLAAALGASLYGGSFLIAIYLQQVMRYDAETTGWLLFPTALASAAIMLALARIAPKLGPKADVRRAVVLGAVLIAVSMWMHSRFTIEIGPDDTRWPAIIRGLGIGLLFVPLTTLAVGHLRGKSLAHGAALYNLARQLGGSVAIAVLTTTLSTRGARHRAALVEHVSAYDLGTQQRLAMTARAFRSRGEPAGVAERDALAALDRRVQQQAMVMAFGDGFVLIALLMVAGIPLAYVLKRADPNAGPVAAH
ncbi:MAG TPA: DHA2 family efflux MFS transporter permease subunit [Gemmatimonadaceae bacterium]|nr:DHA2 family efflux MFS transporter permease subunit [Gemmatimonadaceae bacterium]